MRRVAFAILSTVAGLVGLLSFKTDATGSAATSSLAVANPQAGTSGASDNSSSRSTAATGAGKSSATKTITGSVADTQYGPVQVRITVSHGSVIRATAVEYPNQDPRDAQINAYAVPVLEKEAVGKSSASQVDMVSGATYTSEGYLQSLQSALDKAGL